jgi:P-type E1-E2 ATPase
VIADAIVRAAIERGLKLELPERVRETMGSGLQGVIGGRRVTAGAREMVFTGERVADWATRAIRRASWRSALIVFVTVEGRPVGALLLADELRADTPRAIRLLREAGIARILMVTGDRAAAAQAIGAALDLDDVLAERIPSDKVDAVRSEQRLHPTIMVGDGINDAPALAAADVGIAIGGTDAAGRTLGTDAAMHAAGVTLLRGDLALVAHTIELSRRTSAKIRQNLFWAFVYNVVGIPLAAFGLLNPVLAGAAMALSSVSVVTNALLLRRWRPRDQRPQAAGTPPSPEGD